jgi:hypothetical protein
MMKLLILHLTFGATAAAELEGRNRSTLGRPAPRRRRSGPVRLIRHQRTPYLDRHHPAVGRRRRAFPADRADQQHRHGSCLPARHGCGRGRRRGGAARDVPHRGDDHHLCLHATRCDAIHRGRLRYRRARDAAHNPWRHPAAHNWCRHHNRNALHRRSDGARRITV